MGLRHRQVRRRHLELQPRPNRISVRRPRELSAAVCSRVKSETRLAAECQGIAAARVLDTSVI
eukprot:6211893-Pleurochrysis_carterae.AAC.1